MEDDNLLTADHNPRGKIETSETNEPTIKDYVKEFIKLGFKNKIISFMEKIDIAKINNLIDHSFITVKRKTAFKKLINKRFQELKNEIS